MLTFNKFAAGTIGLTFCAVGLHLAGVAIQPSEILPHSHHAAYTQNERAFVADVIAWNNKNNGFPKDRHFQDPLANTANPNYKDADSLLAVGRRECKDLADFSSNPTETKANSFNYNIYNRQIHYGGWFFSDILVSENAAAHDLCPSEIQINDKLSAIAYTGDPTDYPRLSYGQKYAMGTFEVKEGADSFYSRSYPNETNYIAPGTYTLKSVSSSCRISVADKKNNILSNKVYPDSSTITLTVTSDMGDVIFPNTIDCGVFVPAE